MVLLDIQVPAIDRIYDFELDEEIQIGELLKKIVQMIKEKEEIVTDKEEKLYLYAFQSEKVLRESDSLKQQGVKSGETLFLI